MLLSCDNMGYKVALPFYNFNSAQEGLIKLSLNTLKLVNHAHLFFFFPIIVNLSIITKYKHFMLCNYYFPHINNNSEMLDISL